MLRSTPLPQPRRRRRRRRPHRSFASLRRSLRARPFDNSLAARLADRFDWLIRRVLRSMSRKIPNWADPVSIRWCAVDGLVEAVKLLSRGVVDADCPFPTLARPLIAAAVRRELAEIPPAGSDLYVPVPPPDVIRSRCVEIREEWPDDVRQLRDLRDRTGGVDEHFGRAGDRVTMVGVDVEQLEGER